MKASLVVFVAVAVAAMASAAVVQDRVKRSAGGVRLKMQEARINRLSAQVAALEELLDSKQTASTFDVLMGLQSRLDNQYGGFCPTGEFSCGGLTKECISDLEVCDSISDCANGADESNQVCKNRVAAGTSFKGGRVYDDCTNRKPYEVEVIFTDSETVEWFSSRTKVQTTVILRSKDNYSTSVASLPAAGSYNFATRTTYLNPPEDDRLGLELVFDTSSADSVDCYIVRESTGARCAQFVLFKQ